MKDSIPPDVGALWNLRCDMSELQDSMVQMESALHLLLRDTHERRGNDGTGDSDD